MVSEAHTNQFAQLSASGKLVIITSFKPELLIQGRMGRNSGGPLRTNVFHRLNRLLPGAGRMRRGDVNVMQVAAPVHDAAGGGIGALVLIINPDKEFSRILSVARLGESGETYAFDQAGLMISHSRFDEQLKQLKLLEDTNTSSALNLRLLDPAGNLTKGFQPPETNQATRPLIHLVASAEEVLVAPARDSRGVPVVARMEPPAESAPPMATVSIDLGSRIR